jgi:deazaflavin-dependent oxidoreductase (nitroreductase family)
MNDHDTPQFAAIPTYEEVQRDPDVLHQFNQRIVEEFRANGGTVGGPFVDDDVVLLTMTGAKSGRSRTVPLQYFVLDGRIMLIGTYGGAPRDPAWVHNLRTHPRVHVEIGSDAYDAVAEELSQDRRDAAFEQICVRVPRVARYPKPDRVIPVFGLHRV